jgi:hypothetical protein
LLNASRINASKPFPFIDLIEAVAGYIAPREIVGAWSVFSGRESSLVQPELKRSSTCSLPVDIPFGVMSILIRKEPAND